MAGDWLKVGKDTPDKPEMAILARLLGLSLGDTFLVFFRAFAWADAITSNGRVPFLSLDEAAELARCRPDFVPILSRSCPDLVPEASRSCPSIFHAMARPEVGWIRPIDNDWASGFEFTNWERHNGKSAKARACEQNKKRRQREQDKNSSRSCPDATGTDSGLEKRREEKSINTPPIAPQGAEGCVPGNGTAKRRNKPSVPYPPAFERFWEAYPKHRRDKKGDALTALMDAVQAAIVQHPTLDQMQAEEFIRHKAGQYAASPAGNNGQYTMLPGSWLRAACYESDPTSWQVRNGNGKPTHRDQEGELALLSTLGD